MFEDINLAFVRFTLTSTRDIDETAMSVTSDIILETWWKDPRLVSGQNINPPERIHVDYLSQIWKPETYIMNQIKFEGTTH